MRSPFPGIALAMPMLLLLGGCSADLSTPPDPDLGRVEQVSDIEVPSGATIQEYYSSESDFHGGRDDVYILDIPTEQRTGIWDPSEYGEGVPSDISGRVSEIVESAAAPQDLPRDLTCGPSITKDQNLLLVCFSAAGDSFLLIEQIF